MKQKTKLILICIVSIVIIVFLYSTYVSSDFRDITAGFGGGSSGVLDEMRGQISDSECSPANIWLERTDRDFSHKCTGLPGCEIKYLGKGRRKCVSTGRGLKDGLTPFQTDSFQHYANFIEDRLAFVNERMRRHRAGQQLQGDNIESMSLEEMKRLVDQYCAEVDKMVTSVSAWLNTRGMDIRKAHWDRQKKNNITVDIQALAGDANLRLQAIEADHLFASTHQDELIYHGYPSQGDTQAYDYFKSELDKLKKEVEDLFKKLDDCEQRYQQKKRDYYNNFSDRGRKEYLRDMKDNFRNCRWVNRFFNRGGDRGGDGRVGGRRLRRLKAIVESDNCDELCETCTRLFSDKRTPHRYCVNIHYCAADLG